MLLCCILYFTSYMTRNSYNAALTEIISSTGVSSATAAIALTGSFITYGFGQLISGYLGDRISPSLIITAGMMTTSLCNIAVGLCGCGEKINLCLIIVIWCINGFAQSLIWPPMLRCITKELPPDKLESACALVYDAAFAASIIIYFAVSACIIVSGWQTVFFICGFFGAAIALLWRIITRKMQSCTVEKALPAAADGNNCPETGEARRESIFKIIIDTGIIPVMIVISMHGMLRDGITTWFPSYIKSNFNIPTKYSILVASCVPVLAILSIAFTRRFSKHFKNELHTSARLWGIALISCAGLLVFFGMRMFIAAVFMVTVIGCMHGINLMLISIFPSRFDKYGRISLFSGLLNACTYIGSSISTYVIAVITEKSGWLATIGVWTAVAAAGFILSIISIKKTKNLMC